MRSCARRQGDRDRARYGASRCRQAHGADHLIDTAREDVRARALELTDGKGINVILDPIGGELFTASLRAIAWEGRILVIGFASGEIPQIPANRLLLKNAGAIGFYWGSYRRHDPAVRTCLEQLLRWCVEGRIQPHASDVLPPGRARRSSFSWRAGAPARSCCAWTSESNRGTGPWQGACSSCRKAT